MIDDDVRSTPSMRADLVEQRVEIPIDGASTMTIMSKLPLTECSVRTGASACRLRTTLSASLGVTVSSTCARTSPCS